MELIIQLAESTGADPRLLIAGGVIAATVLVTVCASSGSGSGTKVAEENTSKMWEEKATEKPANKNKKKVKAAQKPAAPVEVEVEEDEEEVEIENEELSAPAPSKSSAKKDKKKAKAAKAKAEANRIAAEAKHKLEAERAAAEKAKAEAERVAAEKRAKAEAERVAAEKARLEAERIAAEKKAKAEAARLAAEAIAEAERIAAEQKAKAKSVKSKAPGSPAKIAKSAPEASAREPVRLEEEGAGGDEGWVVVKSKVRASKAPEAKAAVVADVGAKVEQISRDMDLGDFVSLVFGPGGSNIRRIQVESGAKIDVPKGTSQCTIKGTAVAVELAVAELNKIIGDNESVRIEVGTKGVGSVMGRGGANIKKIQEESGASVSIARGATECVVKGNPGQILKARAIIAEYLEHGGPKPEHVYTMELEKREVSLVIGSGGATIRQIETQTGTKLDAKDSSVTISGSAEAVDQACMTIRSLIETNSFEIIVPLSEDRAVLGAVMGKAGSTMQRVQRETGARCDKLTDEYGSHLRIVGTKKACKQAEKLFTELIESETGPPKPAKGEIVHEFELGGAVGAVIGRSGATVNKIQSESGALVRVKSGTKCFVLGKPEHVEKAVKEIEGIVEKHRLYEEKLKERLAATAAAAEAAAAEGSAVPVEGAEWTGATEPAPAAWDSTVTGPWRG